jgi:steroid delta-isomerase-like uncharacterized protein
MSAENVALVRRWFEEVWNQRRGETIEELVPADSVCFADGGPIRGPVEFRQRQYEPFLAAFPDLQVQVDGAIGQGDDVVVRWTATATHTGPGLGMPPTGRTVTFHGMSWVVVRDGKFHEGWQSSDVMEVTRGLAMHPA